MHVNCHKSAPELPVVVKLNLFVFLESIFVAVFIPFIEMMHMIYRWIRKEIAKLIHFKIFFQILDDLKVIINMVNNYFTDFPFSDTIFLGIFESFIRLMHMIWH
jgi:hypothetical protein